VSYLRKAAVVSGESLRTVTHKRVFIFITIARAVVHARSWQTSLIFQLAPLSAITCTTISVNAVSYMRLQSYIMCRRALL